MTGAAGMPPPAGLAGFAQTAAGRNFFLMLGIAAIIGVMAAIWMWGRQPDYRVLFSNFSDQDGGAIVASLQQLNIPYRFAEGSTAVLVPAEHVHEARLKLASQGLPKGGNVGFELMEKQKLGASQFLEQINFQRALEGELARSIQSVSAVQNARVHLALPKSSVFMRDQQKPTASVLLNLYPGRILDRQQVSAIVHLVASSVPNLPAQNVTLVDQNGNLLSGMNAASAGNGLDPSKLQYVEDLQQNIARRVESIILPIVGPGNVRAEATAEIDFSHIEQASETYKPNQGNSPATIRSQQSSESQNTGASAAAATGIPGALSNQPPAPATAPLDATQNAAAGSASTAGTPSASVQRGTVVNYEVDKSVQYVQQTMGTIKRLSVAVVVNYRKENTKGGKPAGVPLSSAEIAQITNLAREAMGFSKERGDSLSVVNSPFVEPEVGPAPDETVWSKPETISMARDIGKYLLVLAVLGYLFFAVLRPMLRRVIVEVSPPPAISGPAGGEDAVVYLDQSGAAGAGRRIDNLAAARQLARQNPKMVANVVKSWVDRNE